jgi:hypothetical protein
VLNTPTSSFPELPTPRKLEHGSTLKDELNSVVPPFLLPVPLVKIGRSFVPFRKLSVKPFLMTILELSGIVYGTSPLRWFDTENSSDRVRFSRV